MSPRNETLEHLVHIIPMGYEIDRVVIPFHDFPAHRVHLISMADSVRYMDPAECAMTAKQHNYDEQVIRKLKGKGIDVRSHRIDMFDIITVMQTISRIILDEKAEGNRIYVNMSACGKIATVGATLAAMNHDIQLYYVRADRYSSNPDEQEKHGLSICNSPRIWQLENFKFALPADTALQVLSFLINKDNGVSCDEIIRYLIERKTAGFKVEFWNLPKYERRKYQTNYLVKLQSSILAKLDESGYIQKKRVGRNTIVTITKSGRYVAAVSGM